MAIINAHFRGKVFVPDEPVDLREGEAVELNVHRCDPVSRDSDQLLSQLPLIHLSPEDAEAINRDPAFDVEES